MRITIPGGRGLSDLSPLETEVMAEKAAALAQSGRRVESALDALAAAMPEAAERPQLLRAAADAVYGFFIQREIAGMRDHRAVIAHYRIPREVLTRLGAR
jgi:hypothetical protein